MSGFFRRGRALFESGSLRAAFAATAAESVSENVGQTSCLPVWAASCRPIHGARTPLEPAGWKPGLRFRTRFESTQFALVIENGAFGE